MSIDIHKFVESYLTEDDFEREESLRSVLNNIDNYLLKIVDSEDRFKYPKAFEIWDEVRRARTLSHPYGDMNNSQRISEFKKIIDKANNFINAYKKDHLGEEESIYDAPIKDGKMHDVLGIPEDETISQHYSSGKKLADDLSDKVGKTKALQMLVYAYNTSHDDLFRVAKDHLKSKDSDD